VQMLFNPLKARRYLVFENGVFDGMKWVRKMRVAGWFALRKIYLKPRIFIDLRKTQAGVR